MNNDLKEGAITFHGGTDFDGAHGCLWRAETRPSQVSAGSGSGATRALQCAPGRPGDPGGANLCGPRDRDVPSDHVPGFAGSAPGARDYEIGAVTAGVRAETGLGDRGQFVLRNSVGYRAAFGDVDPRALLALASATPFAMGSLPLGRRAPVTERSLDWRVTPPLRSASPPQAPTAGMP